MKTVMQQLLERIEATINNDPINDIGVGQAMALKLMKSRIKNEWLEAEKEQIIEAYTIGHSMHDSNDEESAEDYYTQTFKSDE